MWTDTLTYLIISTTHIYVDRYTHLSDHQFYTHICQHIHLHLIVLFCCCRCFVVICFILHGILITYHHYYVDNATIYRYITCTFKYSDIMRCRLFFQYSLFESVNLNAPGCPTTDRKICYYAIIL